jgi:hypothetical protein
MGLPWLDDDSGDGLADRGFQELTPATVLQTARPQPDEERQLRDYRMT